MSPRWRLISVIGAGLADEELTARARQVGSLVARAGYGLVCGGLGGVMEAAMAGAAAEGGLTVGVIPGLEAAAASPHAQVVVATGLGQARNVLVVASGVGVIAVGGGAGTLSEMGHALKMGKPVVSLGSWQVDGVEQASDPQDAMDRLLARLGG